MIFLSLTDKSHWKRKPNTPYEFLICKNLPNSDISGSTSPHEAHENYRSSEILGNCEYIKTWELRLQDQKSKASLEGGSTCSHWFE